MGIKKTIVGASLASAVVAGAIEKRALAFEPTIITSCTVPGAIALTFDDGPYIYTQKIVDALTAAGHKATFFQNGENYGNIYDYSNVLKSMIAGGHQIGSHTYHHADLATLDAAGIKAEMELLEQAHLAIIGKAPQYLRPPYLSTNDLVLQTLTSLKYHVVSVDIDTQDWAEGPAGRIANSIDWFKGNLSAGGSISLNHDVYQATADTFVPAIITYLDSIGKKSIPVGACLGDDEANWYRGGTVSPSASASAAASASAKASGVAPSGSAKASGAPAPSGTGSGSGPSKPSGGASYPSSGAKPGKPVGGGDTEPGHGPDAGRGALPGKKGSGNDGWSGSYPAPIGAGAAPPAGSGSGSGSYPAGSGSGSGSYGNGTSPAKPSGAYTGPYSNGASSLTGSALAIAAAALVALCL